MTLYQLTPKHTDLQAGHPEVRRHRGPARAAAIDSEATYPQDIFLAARDADLLGLAIPAESGGSGAGVLGLCLAVEEVTRYCQSTALILLLSRARPRG
jgi:alkylation response protein AidB-like acyl-CoA dehydrogenase